MRRKSESIGIIHDRLGSVNLTGIESAIIAEMSTGMIFEFGNIVEILRFLSFPQ
jgi:hypothetical protein